MHTAMPLSPVGHTARLLTACTTVLLVLGPTAASPAAAADSVAYDFESSSQKLPFTAINGMGHVLVGPAPGGRPGRAARVDVPDDGRSFKSELVVKGLDAGSHRFSFANYLPGDWKRQDLDTIVTQWYSSQDDTPRIKPVVALSVNGGDWRLKVHWMTGGEVQETIIPLGAARTGHWNQWTFDITWSSGGRTGSISVVRDGVRVGSHQGANNYHRGDPPHFRIGAYRPAWRPEKGPRQAGDSGAVLFVDDIAISSTTGSAPGEPAAATGAASGPNSPSATPGQPSAGSPSAPSGSASPSPAESGAGPAGGTPVAAGDGSPGGPRPQAADAPLATTGRLGAAATAAIGVGLAVLAGLAFFLVRRRNATRTPRRTRGRSRT